MTPKRHFVVGGLWLIGGLLVTIISYATAAPGHFFFIWWGPTLYGLVRVIRGISLARQWSKAGHRSSGPVTFNSPTPSLTQPGSFYGTPPSPTPGYPLAPGEYSDVRVFDTRTQRRGTPLYVWILGGLGVLVGLFLLAGIIWVGTSNANSIASGPGYSETQIAQDNCGCQGQAGGSNVQQPVQTVPSAQTTLGLPASMVPVPTTRPKAVTLASLKKAGYKDVGQGIAARKISHGGCTSTPTCFAWDVVNYKSTCNKGENFYLTMYDKAGRQVSVVGAGANYAGTASAPEHLEFPNNDGYASSAITSVGCYT